MYEIGEMEMNKDEELLVITMEECSEIAIECSKLIRFGNDAFNTDMLEKEIGDLVCMIELMCERDWVSWPKIYEQSTKKKEKLKVWSSLYDAS